MTSDGPNDAAQPDATPADAPQSDTGVGAPTGKSTSENPSGVPSDAQEPSKWHGVAREITSGNWLVAVLSVLVAVVIGSLLIIATDPDVHETLAYIGARPSDFFSASWQAISGAYSSLFRGAVWDSRASDFEGAIRPFTATLKYAAPLILGGLGVGLAFRAGLFNIGGRGQMLMGGAAASWVVLAWTPPDWSLPGWVPLPDALSFLDPTIWIHPGAGLLAAVVVGGLWGALAGLIKARTGAHEVILTIMLNYVAYYLVSYALNRQGLLQAPGSTQPKGEATPESARLPMLLNERFTLHAGILVALVAVAVVWWLLHRSALGFRFRAVGENPHAARTAGINVGRVYILAMLFAGALVGLAGANQTLGTTSGGVTSGLDAGIGFEAITVALLGRSSPIGILFAGLLFGGFKAGSITMETSEGIPPEIVLVLQSLIVLFLAAPPLVRAMFRLPAKEAK